MDDWRIFRGQEKPHDRIDDLPDPPSWRDYSQKARRGERYRPSEEEIKMVNAALYLRRPLLITGKPGTGKSSLAHAVARELKLGPVLVWPINTRSTLQEGLYRYDAVGRLQAASLAQKQTGTPKPTQSRSTKAQTPDIGQFLRLGPLGTALLPGKRPRVLLIDEIDKSDIDLPNDLLHVFEEGEFEIPELVRLGQEAKGVKVRPADEGEPVSIPGGRVRSTAFPIVFLTSNGEREFPPAFLRRCLQLRINAPDEQRLMAIVKAHLGEEVLAEAAPLITRFLNAPKSEVLATDQLLNAVYMVTRLKEKGGDQKNVIDSLLKNLRSAS
ncbi:dynein-related subfamily AAA family protein [Archangium gephyra]|uniref:Dynein-related subfamily AAA family protein n=1 Tax=Archangium gephyra TaxID=48 RepID=A0AAC8Q4V8_9BACT|nr:MoxR family ATPase [Archangium gephyra]AKJ01100.1 MoxR-like ATPase [Archangium gephyra]REG24583.1 dynein-related subfamily AAA family protein [Archangium gephyra]